MYLAEIYAEMESPASSTKSQGRAQLNDSSYRESKPTSSYLSHSPPNPDSRLSEPKFAGIEKPKWDRKRFSTVPNPFRKDHHAPAWFAPGMSQWRRLWLFMHIRFDENQANCRFRKRKLAHDLECRYNPSNPNETTQIHPLPLRCAMRC